MNFLSRKVVLALFFVVYSTRALSEPLNASINIIKTKLEEYLNEEVKNPSDALKVFVALSFVFEGYAHSTYNCEKEIDSIKDHSFCVASDIASDYAYNAYLVEESRKNLVPFFTLRDRAYNWGKDHGRYPVRMAAELKTILRDSLSVIGNDEFLISKEDLIEQISLLEKKCTGKNFLFLSPFTGTLQSWIISNL